MHEYWLLTNSGWLATPFMAPTRWQAVMTAVASGLKVKGVSPRKPKVSK